MLALVGLLIIIGIYFLSITPTSEPEPTEEQPAPPPEETFTTKPEPGLPSTFPSNEGSAIGGVNLSLTKYEDIQNKEEKYGELETIEVNGPLKVYVHEKEEMAGLYYEVAVSNDETIQYIREPLSHDVGTGEAVFLDEFKQQHGLGEPDITGYDLRGFFDIAYVYLDEGVMVSAFETNDRVHFITYFTPMSSEEFLEIWGDDITDERPSIEEGGF